MTNVNGFEIVEYHGVDPSNLRVFLKLLLLLLCTI